MPAVVSASFFSSLLQKTATQTSASTSEYNSQTLPVLAPAINLDPHPSVGGGDITLVAGSALLAQEGPSGTVADIESRPNNSQISVYVVRDGDTLSGIAKMFDVTPNTIIWANDLKGGVIHPGETLVILPITGIQHTVLKGDTLTSLAKSFNSDAHDIAQYNNLADNASLTPGDTIIIPDGEISRQSATPAKSPTKAKVVKSKTKKVVKKFVPAHLRGVGGPDLGNYYTWPVDGGIITQGLHGFDGVDIGAPKGTDIFAAADGTVIVVRDNGGWNGGYGNYIVVQHDNGTQTLYSHASRVLVTTGETVSQGDVIAKVGATGEATGPHLHFEVRGAKNPFGDIPVGSGE